MIKELVSVTDPVLREPCPEFDFVDPPIDPMELARYLADAMLTYKGLGLSAPQIGLPYRAFVMIGEQITAVFNPKIVDTSPEMIELAEGCLTYPGIELNITRPSWIKVRYTQIDGEVVTKHYAGMTARVFQHELDHLNGILYVDHVSKLKFQIAKAKAKKRML